MLAMSLYFLQASTVLIRRIKVCTLKHLEKLLDVAISHTIDLNSKKLLLRVVIFNIL